MRAWASREDTHFFYVDLLRFVAAAGVVFFHFGTFSGVRPAQFAPATEEAFPFLGDWTRFGWIGVPFFFVLSGVVIAKSASQSTPLTFFVKRAVRILPVLWICATIALLVVVLHEGVSAKWIADWLRTVFLSPKGPYIDGVVWTLVIEAIFYVGTAIAIAFSLPRGGYRAWMDRIALGLTLLTVLYVVVHLTLLAAGSELAEKMSWFGWTVLLLHHGAFFGLGMLISAILVDGLTQQRLLLALLAGVAGSLQTMLKVGEIGDGLIAVAIWIASVVVLLASLRPKANVTSDAAQRILRRLGMMSYPLYLGHFTIGMYLIPTAAQVVTSPMLLFLLAWSFVLMLAFIVAEYPERWIQQWARTALLPPRQATEADKAA